MAIESLRDAVKGIMGEMRPEVAAAMERVRLHLRDEAGDEVKVVQNLDNLPASEENDGNGRTSD